MADNPSLMWPYKSRLRHIGDNDFASQKCAVPYGDLNPFHMVGPLNEKGNPEDREDFAREVLGWDSMWERPVLRTLGRLGSKISSFFERMYS